MLGHSVDVLILWSPFVWLQTRRVFFLLDTIAQKLKIASARPRYVWHDLEEIIDQSHYVKEQASIS